MYGCIIIGARMAIICLMCRYLAVEAGTIELQQPAWQYFILFFTFY